MSGTLAGLRVIDAATNIAGPWAGSILADLGAEVIKVEPLKGDMMRAYPPFVDGVQTQYAAVNHDKRYLALDLREERGRAVLHRCLGGCDVLIQNLRPGHEAKLGLDAAACHAANPRLVHASIAAFHPADGDRPGYDLLVQGESGLMDQTGEPDMPPSRVGAAAIDYASGLWLALGILAELQGERERATVRVSMLDVAGGLLNEKVSAFLATGVAPRRLGSRTATTTPHGAFPTADGHIVIGAATDHAFARLAEVLGPPLDEERFADQAGRLENRDELEAAVAAGLAGRGTEHWLAVLGEAGVPVGRVADLASMTARHRAASRTGFRAVEGVDGLEVMAPAFSFGEREWGPLPPPGEVGADSAAVLADLGLGAAEIAALREQGLIR
ncbi:MAG: CoA transferase [Actinobacteria bacterium]|nr:CoA transferase [Actinomycetota bacterium]